jgi:hypothetical protein
MRETNPYPEKENPERIKPTEEEIEKVARSSAMNWLIEHHIRQGVESLLLDPIPLWDEESREKW